MSVMYISAAWCWREMVSLTNFFVAVIYDSYELREVRCCQRDFQERGPPHQVVMWTDMEQSLYRGSSISSGREFPI